MIDDLDQTLAALLSAELPGPVQLSFGAPDERFPPAGLVLPAINLFLYDLRENLELRSNEISLEQRADGSTVRHAAPVRIDAAYLITAWPDEQADDPAQDEHRLLGLTMCALMRHRTLPQDALRGSLQDQTLPFPARLLQSGSAKNFAEFWRAMGGKPKAGLHYMVTLAVDIDPPQAVTLVTEKEIRMRIETGS